MSFRAAVVGGINTDIWGRPSGRLIPRDSNPGYVSVTPGGVGRNIAHNLRNLGLEVSLIAALGDDGAGRELLAHCAGAGIDMSLSPVIEGRRSSSYLYITGENGDMELAINEMDICDELNPERLSGMLEKLNGFDAVVLDANLSAGALLWLSENVTAPLFADTVSCAKAGKLIPCLGKLRAIKPNAMEAEALTGERDPEKAAKALVSAGVENVFISLGEKGCIACDGESCLCVPAEETVVVNVTGAGDAATAAMVWAELAGFPLETVAKAAMLAGAMTCRSELSNSPELRKIPDLF